LEEEVDELDELWGADCASLDQRVLPPSAFFLIREPGPRVAGDLTNSQPVL
jgi:hypothetical protein